jgi:hypothetical protein
MQQTVSLEANRYSASQEVPCTLWNQKVHLQQPANCPYSALDKSVSHPISLKSTSVSYSHLFSGFPSGLTPSAFPTKTLKARLVSTIHATRHTNLASKYEVN